MHLHADLSSAFAVFFLAYDIYPHAKKHFPISILNFSYIYKSLVMAHLTQLISASAQQNALAAKKIAAAFLTQRKIEEQVCVLVLQPIIIASFCSTA